jgi:hypothetical protein
MAITGSQQAITPARSGLLRSGAGRSGWPLTVGRKVLLYALSNIARSDATRSNYHSGRAFLSLGGVWSGGETAAPARVLLESLTIRDVLNHEPATATFRVQGGSKPPVGQDILVTLGSLNTLERIFAGQVLASTLTHVTSDRRNTVYDVRAIDWTWGLNQRLVTRRWTNTSGTTIAQDIVSLGAPGYNAAYVAAQLPPLDEFTVTAVETSQALTALAKRLGGYWYVDYHKVIHLFVENDPYPATDPTILNAIHPTLRDLSIDEDGSQLTTRVYVEGGGSVARAEIVPGETILPVATAAWYEATGGWVTSGPQQISYTGRSLGGGGGLVGPGASPTGVPTATVVSGTGIDTGAHDYAVTFATAAGESLSSPRVSVVVGQASPPTAALILDPVQPGTGPDPGYHYWATTFQTAAGETTLGPSVVGTIPPSVDPASGPVPQAPTLGGNLAPESYAYAMTTQTSAGESAASPESGFVTMIQQLITPPTAAPVPGTPIGPGTPMFEGDYQYIVTYVDAGGGETPYTGGVDGSPLSAIVHVPSGGAHTIPLTAIPTSPDAHVVRRRLYRQRSPGPPQGYLLKYVATLENNTATTFTDTVPDGSLGGGPRNSNSAHGAYTTAVPLQVPTGPTGTTSRHLYRRTPSTTLKRLATLANNTTTAYTDTAVSATGPAPPSVSQSSPRRQPVKAVPIGGPDVVARKLYRTPANTAAPYKLVTTIADNTTTTAVDTVPDASLGATAPATSTANANRVQLSALPIGAAAVTARKIYRTAANGSALQLLATLADNVTATYLDSLADATLGAAPPAADTSGLQQPPGNVNAGSPTLIVASTAGFRPTGGWAVIGNGQQVIRYSGVTGSSLSGIPASGPGAIVASISYNSTVTASPELTGLPASGVGAIVYTIRTGEDVNLWVQVDDAAAQALVAQWLSSAAAGSHSGIIEEVIQDRRLSAIEARARGRAQLTQRRDLQLRIRYTCRDLNTRSGRTVTVTLLGAPYYLSATFIIQSVTIHSFVPGLPPLFEVDASSQRFSFEDLLRQIGTRTDPTG